MRTKEQSPTSTFDGIWWQWLLMLHYYSKKYFFEVCNKFQREISLPTLTAFSYKNIASLETIFLSQESLSLLRNQILKVYVVYKKNILWTMIVFLRLLGEIWINKSDFHAWLHANCTRNILGGCLVFLEIPNQFEHDDNSPPNVSVKHRPSPETEQNTPHSSLHLVFLQ